MATCPSTHSGSCLCGTIHYTLAGDPTKSVLCHCKNCRRASGSSFMANDWYQESQLKIDRGQERIRIYQDANERSFCSNCGSPLFIRNPNFVGAVIVTNGTQDETERWRPQEEFHCKQRMRWVPKLDGTVVHEEM